ncbi:MAG: IPT/TIG domain-containing protein, partial [Acidimicrobiales bacterium]
RCTNPAEQIAGTTVSAPQTRVTSVLPNAGPLAGGETVTVAGTFFTGATAVDFGGTPATSFSVVNAGTVTAVEPPGTAGTVDVTVTTPLGTSAATPADHYTYTNGPIVTGVAPASGPPAGGTSVTITGLQLATATAVDFGSLPAAGVTQQSATQVTAVSPPQAAGTVDVTVANAEGTSITSALDRFTYTVPGYWTVASDGGIFAFGGAPFYGSMGGKSLNQPIVGMAATPTGGGYWEVARDGGIFAFGDAPFYGSMGGKPLDQPIVGMAPTPTGGGYWEVASDGGVFAFGDAPFYGSTGGRHLSAPVVQMVAAPTGTGYWEVGADGTVYAFGYAGRYGGMGGKALDQPIVAAAATPDFLGNWEVASDGGVFSFGDAGYFGSMGGRPLNEPIVGAAPTADGGGYWMVASDGGIFSFGDAAFSGSMGGKPLDAPMVGMAGA